MNYTHVYRWDLDKTYLETDFDSPMALVKTFFQGPSDKENVPGSDLLIRALRHDSQGQAGVYFLSGSPKQMRRVLQKKLRLDGVHFEEMLLKDNLRNILKGRFRAIKEQVGFKLPALLAARSKIDPDTTETLFGDDAERDAFVYSLYADMVRGVVKPAIIEQVLDLAQLFPDNRNAIYDALDGIEHRACVNRIYIHLNRRSPPIQFAPYGARLIPVYNYLQASVLLMSDGQLSRKHVWTMANHFTKTHQYDEAAHQRNLKDLLRRRRISLSTLECLLEEPNCQTVDKMHRAITALLDSKYKDASIIHFDPDEHIDYVGLLKQDIDRRRTKGPLGFH